MLNASAVTIPTGFRVRDFYVLEYAETPFLVDDVVKGVLSVLSHDPSLTLSQVQCCAADGRFVQALSVTVTPSGPTIVLRPLIGDILWLREEGFFTDERIVRFALYVPADDRTAEESMKREALRFSVALGEAMSTALAQR